MSLNSTNAFKSIRVGGNDLSHRVVMAPTTRLRSAGNQVPSDLALEFYKQRATDNGGLLICEATFVSEDGAALYPHAPGIWSKEQVVGWRKITEAVHEKGSKISLQLISPGRVAEPAILKKLNLPYRAPSAIYASEKLEIEAQEAGLPLEAYSLEDVNNFKNQYLQAAKNAVEAGFDYVELHSAHGYGLDQFLQSVSNQRADKYGGSVENRARLLLELVDLIAGEIGAEKVALRLSPYGTFQGTLGALSDPHPVVQIGYLLSQLEKRDKRIAYVSLIEPRVEGSSDVSPKTLMERESSNDFVYQVWKGVVIKAGGFLDNQEEGYPKLRQTVDSNDRTLVAVARYYTSNPDLVHRLKNGLKLTPYDRSNFYARHNYHYGTYSGYGQEELPTDSSESQRMPVALA